MMKKKDFVVCLFASCLVSMLFTVLPTRSSPGVGEYNPWYDLNDDGVIDGSDNIEINRGWGSWGTPIAKASLEYDSGWINITDEAGQYIPLAHLLNSMDLIVDITGKTTSGGWPHQRNLGSIIETPGWKTTVVEAPGVNAYGRSMVMTGDGGFIIAGTTTSSPDWDYILVKTDEYGDVQWNRRYLKTGTEDAYSVAQASDGGYVIAGTSQNASGTYACIVKTDSAGYELWDTTFGTAGQQYATYSVIEADGCYIAAGMTNGWSGTFDFWLMKLETVFGYVFWGVAYTNISNTEIARSVVQATDHSGYVLVGYTGLTSASLRGMLLKTDTNGIALWNKTYGPNVSDAAGAWALIQTGDGGYAFAGYTESGGMPATRSAWLVKTDAYGNAQWNQTYGGTSWDEARAIVQTADLGYALAGSSNSFGSDECDIWLVKTDVESGLALVQLTQWTVLLYRGADDPYWNYVRVQIWKPK